jgi:hypothetical protein
MGENDCRGEVIGDVQFTTDYSDDYRLAHQSASAAAIQVIVIESATLTSTVYRIE